MTPQQDALLRLQAAQLALGELVIDGDPQEKFQARVKQLYAIAWPDTEEDGGSLTFSATKSRVSNRGNPPDSFLTELVRWGRTAASEIFEPNLRADIYTSVQDTLDTTSDPINRRAVMLEVLRVLGGFESSWDWNCGRDSTNPNVDEPENEEAGIFQTSYDSIGFDGSLEECMNRVKVFNAVQFIPTSKSNHTFAMEYTARLLRFTTEHHGPIKRKETHRWMRKASVAEFQKLLA